MEIQTGDGLGEIKFGMTIELIERLLGEPDKIDRSDSEQPLYLYNKLCTTIWFNEDSRAHWIQCSAADVELCSMRVIGKDSREVLDRLTSELAETFELDDYGSFESYSFDTAQLEVQVEYGRVCQVCFGHLWSDDDSPIYAAP